MKEYREYNKRQLSSLPEGTIIEDSRGISQSVVVANGIVIIRDSKKRHGHLFKWDIISRLERFVILEEVVERAEQSPASCNCSIVLLLQAGCFCGAIRRWEKR